MGQVVLDTDFRAAAADRRYGRQSAHRSIRERFRGNPNKLPISNVGGTVKYLGRQYEGGKLTHYRGWKEDLRPYVDRAKAIANGSSYSKNGYGYLGSMPRIVIDHWLRQQGKTWEDYGRDNELSAKFKKWFESNFKKMLAGAHQERSLAINRSIGGRTGGPRLGAQILNDYREETSHETRHGAQPHDGAEATRRHGQEPRKRRPEDDGQVAQELQQGQEAGRTVREVSEPAA